MERAELIFSSVAALLALTAAVFWFASAFGEVPRVAIYWDHAPENDPFSQSIKFSARMNVWAASFSGASALSWAMSLLAHVFKR
jgi:hypothetical protein